MNRLILSSILAVLGLSVVAIGSLFSDAGAQVTAQLTTEHQKLLNKLNQLLGLKTQYAVVDLGPLAANQIFDCTPDKPTKYYISVGISGGGSVIIVVNGNGFIQPLPAETQSYVIGTPAGQHLVVAPILSENALGFITMETEGASPNCGIVTVTAAEIVEIQAQAAK